MNGALLQQRIYAGQRIAAKRAGSPYSVYRSASPISPLEAGNLIGPIDCLFSANAYFTAPHKYKFPARHLYADGRALRPRDILLGPYGTFFVADMQPNLPIQAILCNDSIAIDRPVYQGTVIVPQPIAFALPIFRQLKKVDVKHIQFGTATAGTAIDEYFGFLPVAVGTVKQHDIITDQAGRLYELDSIDNTEIGVLVTFRQTET